MDNILFNKAAVPVAVCRERKSCDISDDFTLPDYLPGIHKLLRVEMRMSTPSKYASGNAVKVAGTGEYDLLYLSGDGEIYSAKLPMGYEITANIPSDADFDRNRGLEISADISPDTVVSRVTGERKLSIKSCLSADILAVGTVYADDGGIPNEDHIQKLLKEREFSAVLFGENSDIEAVDELEIGVGERYICTDCKVYIEQSTAFDGYAECKGCALLRHLMRGREGKLCTVSNKVNFSEIVEIDGLKAGDTVIACGACSEIPSSDASDEFGEEKPFTVTARLNVKTKAFQKRTLPYVQDAYSTDHICSCETVKYSFSELLAASNKNMTLSSLVPVSEIGNFDIGAAVADITVHAAADSVEVNDAGKLVISGKCRFGMVLAQDNGSGDGSDYGFSEAEVPFKYECSEIGGSPDSFSVTAEAVNPTARLDEGNICLGCEIFLCYDVMKTELTEPVTAVRLGERCAERRKGFTVCYPDKSDSLWSISKKYKAPLAQTAAANGMECESNSDEPCLIDGVKYMIV